MKIYGKARNNEFTVSSLLGKGQYSENCLETQFELLAKCASYMIDPIGGLWKENEALFHLLPDGKNDKQEQNKLLKELFS